MWILRRGVCIRVESIAYDNTRNEAHGWGQRGQWKGDEEAARGHSRAAACGLQIGDARKTGRQTRLSDGIHETGQDAAKVAHKAALWQQDLRDYEHTQRVPLGRHGEEPIDAVRPTVPVKRLDGDVREQNAAEPRSAFLH